MKTLSPPSDKPSMAPSPAVSVTELHDPTSVGQSIEVLKQDVVKLTSHPLRAKRVVVRLGDCFVVFHSTNLAVRVRVSLQPGFVAYTAFAALASGTVNGLPVRPTQILASAADVDAELIVAAGYESVAYLLPLEVIQNHVVRREREDEIRIPEDIKWLSSAETHAQELYDWGRRLIDIACRQPDLFENQEAQSAAQAEMLERLFATLGSATPFTPTEHELTQQLHSRIVQAVENFTLSHASERTHVTDLCEVAGVSERTLQYAFKELFGMTPTAYLSRLRLHCARQTLRAASNASTTVAKEALRWGFWHFGDFSRAYKDCFGELPSDTLRDKGKTKG